MDLSVYGHFLFYWIFRWVFATLWVDYLGLNPEPVMQHLVLHLVLLGTLVVLLFASLLAIAGAVRPVSGPAS